jgi:two-component system sensor histidine kinase VicK
MDHLAQVRQRIQIHLLSFIIIENVVVAAGGWALGAYTSLPTLFVIGIALLIGISAATVFAVITSRYAIQPLQALWQAIVHISPSEHGVAAPDIDNLRLGKELVASLTAQIYQLATVAEHAAAETKQQSQAPSHNFIALNLPIPLIVLDATETIVFINAVAADYVGIAAEEMVGKNFYTAVDMSFPNEDTFDSWLKGVKGTTATAVSSWERVRLNVGDNQPVRLFDLAAYYNQGNPDQTETMLVLFDHTKQYSQEDQAISFMALSVHELRTPMTLLRGYIEVIEEELEGKVTPELQNYILKMHTMAEQLMVFVNNILNVARIDSDQLQLQLQEEQWANVLQHSLEAMVMRAKVRGITIDCTIAPDLPAVGVDRLSINEVVNNLVDNAIKYSGTSKVIKVDAHVTSDGLVETTIQDFGLGITSSSMPNLFTKFYRDHRNRSQIGGTGLGLYLSKAIVTAHGGNLWVRSKEGEGSTFGFTLLPYARLTDELKQSGNKEITRGAHGWIKNHSLYRR